MNRTKVLLSLADQAASSATNILVLLAVARVTSPSDFGVFSTIYLLYIFVLGVHQAYIGQVLVLSPRERVLALSRGSLRVAVGSTALIALLVGAIAILVPEQYRPAALTFALAIPFLVLQDVTRFISAALKRPLVALTGDLVWLFLSLPPLLFATSLSVPSAILLWGGGALAGLAVALLMLKREGTFSTARDYGDLFNRRGLSPKFTLEFATTQAAQLPVLVIGLAGDVLTAGTLRSASTLMGPLNILFSASQTFGTPALISRSRVQQDRYCQLLTGSLALVALLWSCLLIAIPASWGRQLLGASWDAAYDFIWLIGLQYIFLGVLFSARLWVRLVAPRATLRVQVLSSIAAVVLVSLGYVLLGIYGTGVALVLVTVLQCVLLVQAGRRDAATEAPSDAHLPTTGSRLREAPDA